MGSPGPSILTITFDDGRVFQYELSNDAIEEYMFHTHAAKRNQRRAKNLWPSYWCGLAIALSMQITGALAGTDVVRISGTALMSMVLVIGFAGIANDWMAMRHRRRAVRVLRDGVA